MSTAKNRKLLVPRGHVRAALGDSLRRHASQLLLQFLRGKMAREAWPCCASELRTRKSKRVAYPAADENQRRNRPAVGAGSLYGWPTIRPGLSVNTTPSGGSQWDEVTHYCAVPIRRAGQSRLLSATRRQPMNPNRAAGRRTSRHHAPKSVGPGIVRLFWRPQRTSERLGPS